MGKCFQAAGINQADLKFTYIIVSKRHNTRFFRMNGKPSNPPSGTVVDSDVTLPERYDFFLVSQSVNQGTVNPTSYNVVKDTSGLLPKHIQALTYKLTHLYYNWPAGGRAHHRGSVATPGPAGSGSSMDALSTALSATAIGSSSGSTNGANGESSTGDPILPVECWTI